MAIDSEDRPSVVGCGGKIFLNLIIFPIETNIKYSTAFAT